MFPSMLFLFIIGLCSHLSSQHKFSSSSAVTCSGNSYLTRRCYFRNLCYSITQKQFLFINGSQSYGLEYLTHIDNEGSLAEIAGVVKHSFGYFNLLVVSEEHMALHDKNTFMLPKNETYVIAKRFLPFNVMHVLHDDILPIWATVEELKTTESLTAELNSTSKVLFIDEYEDGPYWNFYNFCVPSPALLNTVIELAQQKVSLDYLCLPHVVVGLSRATNWYQYGFGRSQGPVLVSPHGAQLIRRFVNFIVEKALKLHCVAAKTEKDIIVVFSRKTTRLIINELELVAAIVSAFKTKVIVLSLEKNSVEEIICYLQHAKAVVGVHGSLLSFSLFLPKHSVVVELFPYAVNAVNYTPYKTLCDLEGIDLIYRSWQNLHKHQSVAYPHRSPVDGGISHLLANEQDKILSSTLVKASHCCSDPEFLFRINQDTVVDIPAIISILSEALQSSIVKANYLN